MVGQDGVHVHAATGSRPRNGRACSFCGGHVCFEDVHFIFVDGIVADVVAGLVEVHHGLVECGEHGRHIEEVIVMAVCREDGFDLRGQWAGLCFDGFQSVRHHFLVGAYILFIKQHGLAELAYFLVGEKRIDEDAFILIQQIQSARPEVLDGEGVGAGLVFFNEFSSFYDVDVFGQLIEAAGGDAGGEGCNEAK